MGRPRRPRAERNLDPALDYRPYMALMPVEVPPTEPLAPDAASFARFHREVLPDRIAAGTGELAHDYLARRGTMAVRTPAGSWTYVPRDGSVTLIEGEGRADVVVALGMEGWLGLATDLDTAPGLLDMALNREFLSHENGWEGARSDFLNFYLGSRIKLYEKLRAESERRALLMRDADKQEQQISRLLTAGRRSLGKKMGGWVKSLKRRASSAR